MSPRVLISLFMLLVFARPCLSVDRQPYFDRPAGVAGQEVSASRLLAGLRAYPDGVLDAFLTLAWDSALLDRVAEDPEVVLYPDELDAVVGPQTQAALRELQGAAELLWLAAAHPVELAVLRRMDAEAPDDLRTRVAELRARYEVAGAAGARAWQQLLQRQPGALDAYADLLTRFCREQLEEYPAFPYVVVLRREYYYACPPSELLMLYAQHAGVPAALDELLRVWWDEYAPERVDERVLFERGPIPPAVPGDFVAAWPPERRASMWRLADEGPGASVDLVPVIMQPLADQPAEARLAFAVAEHARLWATPEISDQPLDDPVLVGEPIAVDERERAAPTQVVVVEPATEVRQYVRVYEDEPVYYATAVPHSVSVRTYRTLYDTGLIWYYGYPRTWPWVCYGVPWPADGYVYRSYLGYGPRACVSYRGSRARVSVHLGGGARVYYHCPVPRRVTHVRHAQRRVTHLRVASSDRRWINYGAPYGGRGGFVDGRYVPPTRRYWQNYGYTYGDRPGLMDRESRRTVQHPVIRRGTTPRSAVTVRRPAGAGDARPVVRERTVSRPSAGRSGVSGTRERPAGIRSGREAPTPARGPAVAPRGRTGSTRSAPAVAPPGPARPTRSSPAVAPRPTRRPPWPTVGRASTSPGRASGGAVTGRGSSSGRPSGGAVTGRGQSQTRNSRGDLPPRPTRRR